MESTAPSTNHVAPSFAHATAGDAMRLRVLTADPATPLVTVAQRMAGEGVHAIVVLAPVNGAERTPWGVVTSVDLLRHAARVDELTAGDVASRDVVQAFPDEPLAEVATRMARRAVTHALVVDRPSGHPIGVLSTLDVARVLAWGRAPGADGPGCRAATAPVRRAPDFGSTGRDPSSPRIPDFGSIGKEPSRPPAKPDFGSARRLPPDARPR